MGIWNTRSRRFYDIGARVPDIKIWSLGKKYDLSEATWGRESHLANAPDVLVDYLCHVKAEEQSTRTKGAITSVEGACKDLPWPGCISMGWEELVLNSSLLFG